MQGKGLWLGFKGSVNSEEKKKPASLFLLTSNQNSISFHYELWDLAFPAIMKAGTESQRH